MNGGVEVSQVIPWQSLSDEALRGIIEDFVTREGTEYGFTEVSLDSKVAQVLKQLQKVEAIIVFDSESNSCSIRQPGSDG